MKVLQISFVFLFVMLQSCKKDQPLDTSDNGSDYFPANKNSFITYECDSTVHLDLNVGIKHYKFLIKEKIDSNFTDNEGKKAIRISRYKKWIQYDTLSTFDTIWKIQDVWWGNVDDRSVEIVEENNRIIKLVFPVEVGKTWNGNAYNNNGKWDFEYTEKDSPLNIGNLYFPKTLQVNQFDSENILIFYKKYNEKYARGVGMIYKEIEDYTWKESNGTIQIGVIKFGFHYTMNAIQYGQE